MVVDMFYSHVKCFPTGGWMEVAGLHLSEDEAGGGGAAVGSLQSAPPGVSPSVHLWGTTSSLRKDIHPSLYPGGIPSQKTSTKHAHFSFK